jgi:hypothetical protein
MKKLLSSKKFIVAVIIVAVLIGGFFLIGKIKNNKKTIALSSLSLFNKISVFLPIQDDTKQELKVVDGLVSALTKKDNIERRFLLLLQNNMELRPGGGFLGQYAVIKIKNGEVTSSFFEDANLLDQRIIAEVAPPYPFQKMLQLKKWKFRDSNFSPDFPTNAEKAKYFYRLAGGNSNFDGVIAVNADVLNSVLTITGPVVIPGTSVEINSDNATLKLEELVEKVYIMNPEIDTQTRKVPMKKLTDLLIQKLFNLGNITKIAELAHNETKNKNIMFNFTDPELQSLVESVHWDGKVANDWGSDYLMLVDANMGALKSDYYIKRSIDYNVDLTQEKPIVELNIKYRHTAQYGDWRTSDYHSYLRVYTPKGSNLLDRKMVSYPNVQEEFNKTYFGFIVHTIIGNETNAYIKYELPADLDRDNYRLLIQKQSGVGDVPVKVTVKTKDGTVSTQEQVLKKDLRFEFQESQKN